MNGMDYDFVRAIPKSRDRLPAERMHHWRNPDLISGEIEAELVALQPLHIGTGSLALPADLGLDDSPYPMVQAFFRTGPEYKQAIPAASLKGVVRSVIEAITASCINKARQRGRYGSRVNRSERECQYRPDRGWTQLCVACSMFGAMGYQGQVSFEDAPQIAGGHTAIAIPPQRQPKPRDSQRKFYYHSQVKPGVWPLEVCSAGSRFELRAHFHNLTEAEVGLLLVALGEPAGDGHRLCLKVGGAKNAGLGSARVEGLKLRLWQDPQAAYLAYESDQDLSEVSPERYVEAAQAQDGPLHPGALRELQRILTCPDSGGAV
jgi:CRISPR/Cas system CSM-associated protein Csm3 (group 7 of RAMP superfamily)